MSSQSFSSPAWLFFSKFKLWQLEGILIPACAWLHVWECSGGDAGTLKIACQHLHASLSLQLKLCNILISKYEAPKL